MIVLEISATVLGLLQALFVLLNKRLNWVFYILQMICMIIFSLKNKFYGDVSNNCIYLIFGIIGFITWRSSKPLSITICTLKEKLIYILLITLSTIILHMILKQTQDPKPLIDAFTTTSSFVATYYMVKRKLDTWIIWFVNDIAYSIQYILLDNPAYYLMALNIIWTFMAIASYQNWLKIIRKEKPWKKYTLQANLTK